MGNRKPNWMVWANVPTVELLGAIALSLDIDPREVRHSRDGWMAGGGEPFLDEGKEFLDRLEVAKRNLSQSGPLVPTALVRGAPHKCEVPISAFGQWARSIGWELPNEFPTSILATPPIQTVSGGWPWGSHETELLRKLASAADRFWKLYDPADSSTAPTNEQVIAWLTQEGVAQRNAEVMATILRADGLPTGPRK